MLSLKRESCIDAMVLKGRDSDAWDDPLQQDFDSALQRVNSDGQLAEQRLGRRGSGR